MQSQCKPTMSSTGTCRRAGPIVIVLLLASLPLRADVCVWRDPERTMQKLFPRAGDYKTTTVKITSDQISRIEKSIGVPLDESEKGEFNFYEIRGTESGSIRSLGTVIALAGKGEYGAIEVVIGVNGGDQIVSAYIQRSRERATKALQSAAFLDQFVGKSRLDAFEIGRDLRSASPDGEQASRLIAFVIKKMLVFHEVLKKGDSK